MSRVLAFINSSHWAMLPSAYISMRAVIESWASLPSAPPRLSPEARDAAISAAQADAPSRAYSAPSSIAVLPMFGIIAPRVGMLEMSSEGVALDGWMQRYVKVMNDPEIAGVVVNCDSPGGSVHQVQEAGERIFSLRSQKPNVCVVTGLGASAAFHIATQFSELVISPSAQVGSIGVIMCHHDMSKMAEMAGVEVTYIASPRGGNKAEGNPFTPLSEDTIEWYNSQSDIYYEGFLAALSRGRGIKSKVIDQTWGRGRMLGAKQALALGMVDRVSSLQHEIDKMATSLLKRRPNTMRAEHVKELKEFEDGALTRIDQWESVQPVEELAEIVADERNAEMVVEALGEKGAEEALRIARAKLELAAVASRQQKHLV